MLNEVFSLLGCTLTATGYGFIMLEAYKSYKNSDS